MESEHGHVPLDALWQYQTQKKPLTEEQLAHAIDCRHCVYILSVCMICPTLEDVKEIEQKTDTRAAQPLDRRRLG